ncbi:hypothetical protein DH2020_033338 [Rehmannia glutinosa]|uniref:Myb-like domain-containing protein n=1 Tax=Rehmannia glutinosa TaxID=99300 RepID=A0ABR0VCP5_REHGL
MAVDLHTLPPCEGGIEASPEGGDEKGKEPELPSTTACGGGDDVAEAVVYKKGAWSKEEDEKLRRAVDKYGLRNWVAIEKFSPGQARQELQAQMAKLFEAQFEKVSIYTRGGGIDFSFAFKIWQQLVSHCCQVYLLTASSSYQKQSPTNYVTDQTSTPTSHNTQNLLLSPNPTDQTPLLITNSSNAFTPLRKPPILSSPNGPLRRFSRAASKLSPDSSMQIQSSSAMESPRSPLKLNLSPRIPYPTPLSPLKLRLSIPIPSESCFQSNLSITDSTVQLSSSTEAVQRSSPQMNGLDLPPIQPMSVNTDNIIHVGSSQTIKTEPPSIQVYQPVTPGANSGVRELEPDNDSEIMEELREAQSRVRFLKKKLRLRRISNKRSLKGSSETTDLLKTEVPIDGNSSESATKECLLQTSSRTKNFLDDILGVKAPPKNSKKNVRRGDMIGISNEGALQVTSGSKENKLSKLQKGRIRTYSLEWQDGMKIQRRKTSLEESLQREEDSLGNILKRNNSMTFQEQMHSIDLFDHLNIQNIVNAPNSDSWDYNKLCPFQGPAGKSLNECSTIEGLFSESSTLLQDSSFQGDLFGQRSEIEAFGPVYSQSTATTLVKPVDDGAQLSFLQPYQDVYFGYSFGRENSENLEGKLTEDGLMDDNLAVKSILSESNLFLNQYPSADLIDSSHLVSTTNMEHESSERREPQLCESSLLLHQTLQPIC